uniref:hypothetical protein n=1 Tax=Cyanobium sp. TaxID=2164130 RepID=UPI004047E3CF
MSDHSELGVTQEDSIRLTINIPRSLLGNIDEVRKEWGFRSRGATVERILQELFEDWTTQELAEELTLPPQTSSPMEEVESDAQ